MTINITGADIVSKLNTYFLIVNLVWRKYYTGGRGESKSHNSDLLPSLLDLLNGFLDTWEANLVAEFGVVGLPQSRAVLGVLRSEPNHPLCSQGQCLDDLARCDVWISLFGGQDRCLESKGDAAAILSLRLVEAAAVHRLSGDEQHIASLHFGRHSALGICCDGEVGPLVRARDDARCAVLLSEVGQGDEEVDGGFWCSRAHGAEDLELVLIAMQPLRNIARTNLNHLGSRQPVCAQLRVEDALCNIVAYIVVEQVVAEGLAGCGEPRESLRIGSMEGLDVGRVVQGACLQLL